jgi:flagellar biosynthesis protein
LRRPISRSKSFRRALRAPKLTAKGTGDIAERIVETAEAAGVPVEHNEPLAQSLSQLELEQQIPKELYRAVAEVIGFIMKKTRQA